MVFKSIFITKMTNGMTYCDTKGLFAIVSKGDEYLLSKHEIDCLELLLTLLKQNGLSVEEWSALCDMGMTADNEFLKAWKGGFIDESDIETFSNQPNRISKWYTCAMRYENHSRG